MRALLDGALFVVSPTNLLALIAIALFAGRYGRVFVAALAFGIGVASGALVIATAMRNFPAMETQLGLAALTGLFVAAGYRPPFVIPLLLSFAGGEALALNAPPQAITLAGAALSQVATGLAGIALFLLVTLCAAIANHGWQRIALRVAGSWIAASAILVLVLRLAR